MASVDTNATNSTEGETALPDLTSSLWHWQLAFVLVVFFYPLFPVLVFGCRWCKTALCIVPLYPVLFVLQCGGLVTVLNEDSAGHWGIFFLLFCIGVCGVTTMLICMHTTWRHLDGCAIGTSLEKVIYILALPAFYNVMCCRSGYQYVDFMFDAVSKHWCFEDCSETANENEGFTEDMSNFYFATAGVFEAIALKCFGQLVMQCIRSVRQVSTIENLTMMPVFCYCMILLAESLYHLVYVLMKHFHVNMIFLRRAPQQLQPWLMKFPSLDEFREATHWCFIGAKNVGLFLAISGLLIVERNFHKELKAIGFLLPHDDKFASGMCAKLYATLWKLIKSKFLGVKILVTLESACCCITWACGAILSLNDVWQGLLYAWLSSFGCVLVAWIHTVAYAPGHDWLRESQRTADEEEQRGSVTSDDIELSRLNAARSFGSPTHGSPRRSLALSGDVNAKVSPLMDDQQTSAVEAVPKQ